MSELPGLRPSPGRRPLPDVPSVWLDRRLPASSMGPLPVVDRLLLPQLTMIPNPEKVEEEAFTGLIRWFDYPPAKQAYNGSEAGVNDAEEKLTQHLSQTFRKHVHQGVIILVASLLIGTLFNRWVMPVPAQVHGLVLNLFGSTILALNTVQGRYLIANQTVDQENQGEIRRDALARQAATTAAGMFAFITGFLIQLLAVLFLS